jgi:hypothetical protein
VPATHGFFVLGKKAVFTAGVTAVSDWLNRDAFE